MFIALKEHMLANLIAMLGAGLAAWVAKRVAGLLKSIEDKYNIDIDDGLEKRMQDVARGAVKTVYQTYVEGLKAKGAFTPDNQADAIDKAMGIILQDIKGTALDGKYISKKNIKAEIEKAIAREKATDGVA